MPDGLPQASATGRCVRRHLQPRSLVIADDPQTTSDTTTSVWPRAYRALILKPDGTLVRQHTLVAFDDEEATELAEVMLDGHAVELWDGLRFIEHIEAVHTGF